MDVSTFCPSLLADKRRCVPVLGLPKLHMERMLNSVMGLVF
jgi:hypothetical protein